MRSCETWYLRTPTPGTPLYRRLQHQRRLLFERWWLHPDYRYGHALLRPAGMSPEELTSGCRWARRSFTTYRSILQRLWDTRTNLRSLRRLGIYLRYVPLFAKAVFKKNGMLLGT